jgi:hypothetical protein
MTSLWDGKHFNLIMRPILIGFLVSTLGFVAEGQIYLTAGNSYVFDFTIPLVRPAANDPAGAVFGFTGGAWGAQMDFFADTLADTPFLTETYSHTGASESIGFGVYFDTAPWPDRQGAVRVTVLSGGLQLDGFRVHEVVGGSFCTTSWITPVPEPAGTNLMAVGGLSQLLAFALRRVKPRRGN